MSEKLEKTVRKTIRKPKSELESRSFRDGAIYLFKRADYKKPTWFCRVKIPGAKGYISQSTKTTDEHAAYKFADDLFHKGLVRVQEQQIKSDLAAYIDQVVGVEWNSKKPEERVKGGFLLIDLVNTILSIEPKTQNQQAL